MDLGILKRQESLDITSNSFMTLIRDTTTQAMTSLYHLDYNPEMEALIHPHWRRFPPVTFAWHLLTGAIILGLAVVSLSGNAAVIYIFSQ